MPLNKLNLPKGSVYKQFVPKKQFYEHGQFTQAEQRIFTQEIERITLYAQLTRDNTNINRFKDELKTYEEISIFLVELRKTENINKIAHLVMETIPYPIIFIGYYQDRYSFYGAHQRDNKVDDEKIILERVYQTGFVQSDATFFQKICYERLSKNNFYEFYNDYVQAIIQFNLENRNVAITKNSEAVLNEIERLENEMKEMKNKLKRENQFNKKMEINMKIKRIEKKLKQMEE